MNPRTITVAHSPDADDAFMFWGLASGRVTEAGLEFRHVLSDIETLNQEAESGLHDLTALSFHGFAYVADRYALLGSGASIGEGYGPVVVARRPAGRDDLRGRRIAIPGPRTTAALALGLWLGPHEAVPVPFDQVGEAVRSGKVDAGVIIHEGQLTVEADGLRRVVDLGAWWGDETGLPLPLGGNAVRRDLGPDLVRVLARTLRRSIECGLAHREEALAHALRYARGLAPADADRFVGMYVNRETVSMSAPTRRAIALLLDRAAGAGLLPAAVPVEFVD